MQKLKDGAANAAAVAAMQLQAQGRLDAVRDVQEHLSAICRGATTDKSGGQS